MGGDDVQQLGYLDFELLIGAVGSAGYPVSLIRSPAGEIAHDELLQLPFTSAELETFLTELPFILLRSGHIARPPASSDEHKVRDFGRKLFEALFAGALLTLYRRSQLEAEHQGRGLRLKLRIRSPELAALPWELLFDPQQDDYVCLSRYTPIVRYLEVDRPIRPFAVKPPLRILGLAASPSGMFQLGAAEEQGRVTEALKQLEARGLVELTWWEGQTWRALQAALRAGPWHVFHFIGHGSFQSGEPEGAVFLADEAGRPYRLSASALARLLVDHRPLRFVILNACQGAQAGLHDTFASTAATLVRRGVPAVLAMQHALSDRAAVHFTREFYQALAGWLPIDAAVTEARKAVRMATGGSLEWATPALYMRSPDGLLFAPAADSDFESTRVSLPHNLPPRNDFIGRESEKARVRAALHAHARLVAIVGIGGIGKTALALEVAHECVQAGEAGEAIPRFAGVIWIGARERNLTLNTVLDTIARTLDYRGVAWLPIEDQQSAIRELLQAKAYLLLVDNFETIVDEAARGFLLNLPEPSTALITTREYGLPDAWVISLGGLTDSEARVLIRSEGKRLGLASLEHADDRVLLDLYQATGGAPLAIKWAVGQIKQQGQALDIVLRALREARGNIFTIIFARSWSLLSPAARQVLRVMPLFAAPASRAGLQAAAGIPADAVLDEALGQLVEMSLVDAADDLDLARKRYSLHPLTRAFSAARSKDEPEAQADAYQRLAEYYLAFSARHGGFWNQPGFAQIEPELPNILSVIRWFWDRSSYQPVASVFNNIIDFLIIRGYWNDLVTLGERVVALALAAGDELNAARVRTRALAWVARHRDELDAAAAHLQWSLPIFERFGATLEYFHAKRNLGRVAELRGAFAQAEQVLNEALTFFRAAGDERHVYLTTANLGKVALERGDWDTAWSVCAQALEAARRYNDPERIASLLKVMGSVAQRRRDHPQAKALWSECLTQLERAHRLDGTAEAQFRLAQIELEIGDLFAARRLLASALEAYRRLNMSSKVREIETLLALV